MLQQFRQAFADVNLSPEEARQLRSNLASFGKSGGSVETLRHQLFALAHERFNTFKDKAVLEWLEEASALLPNGTVSHQESNSTAVPMAYSSQVYFSPGLACVEAIQRFVQEARHTLDICVFTVADDRLTDALLAAHHRGVRLRLLTDNDKVQDRGSDVQQLHAAGIPTRTDRTEYHMHHKFALADGRAVLTGSYNWTRSAAAHNHENLLITQEPAIVGQYLQEFNRLWEEMTVFGAPQKP
ncbi:PLD-like domain-containing protein [Hymenobacter gelipurpurascens]|uniref:phospholipase D n=1 Tax=Hymenobacter gelipurpurascens TaxID=89968 RepID=A0A212UDR7_9BACT|nr:PLD-like domain-containing protein [Hymenobacter gelipurpurascens]